MKKIKILVILIILTALIAANVIGWGKSKKQKKLLIGVAAANFDDKWMSYMHDGFREGAKEQKVDLVMVDGKNDPAVQQSQIDTLITKGCDAIVIVPVDQSAIAPIINATEKAKIPLVAVNRKPEEPYLSKLATYVGSDELYAGTIQMEEIAKLLKGKGNVVIMMGELGHSGAIGRTQGNEDVIAKYPGIKIVRKNTAEWSRAKGLELMENWIQSGIKIDAVVSNNDEMAIGAIMALEQVGMLGKVLVAGVDATPDALQFMKEGKLNVTVFQDAYGQGKGGIECAIKAAKGEKLQKVTYIPYELVTPDVVDKYIAKWK